MSSEEVKELRERILRNFFNVLRVDGDLVSVHAHHRHFDGSTKVEIVVGKVVRGSLENAFGKA